MEDTSTDGETFDLSQMATANRIVNMIQIGNYLECTSELGQVFRKAIPPGKILNKNEKGEWTLEDVILRG